MTMTFQTHRSGTHILNKPFWRVTVLINYQISHLGFLLCTYPLTADYKYNFFSLWIVVNWMNMEVTFRIYVVSLTFKYEAVLMMETDTYLRQCWWPTFWCPACHCRSSTSIHSGPLAFYPVFNWLTQCVKTQW